MYVPWHFQEYIVGLCYQYIPLLSCYFYLNYFQTIMSEPIKVPPSPRQKKQVVLTGSSDDIDGRDYVIAGVKTNHNVLFIF